MIKTSLFFILFTVMPSMCFSTDSVTQEAYGDNSQNIVADNVNFTGLARKQYEELLGLYGEMNNRFNELNLRYDEYKLEKDRDLKKIDELVSQIYVNTLNKANDEDFLNELTKNYDAIIEKNRLIEEDIERENVDKINYSASVIEKVTFLFSELVSHVNGKMKSLEKFKKIEFLYNQNSENIPFFRSSKIGTYTQISKSEFPDGSILKISMKSGSVEGGIIKEFPTLLFSDGNSFRNNDYFKVISTTRKKGGYIKLRGNPEYMKEKKREWKSIPYYPDDENIVDEKFYDWVTKNLVEIVSWLDYRAKAKVGESSKE